MDPDTSFSATQLVMLMGALQGLMLSVASFFWNQENRTANRLFAGIITLLSLMMLGVARGLAGVQPEDAPYGVLHTFGAVALLLGPMIYFYIRTSVDASYLFKSVRLVHGIPALVHLSLLLPFLFVGPEVRASYVATYLERELFRSIVPGIPTGFVVTSCYALASFIWIRRYEKHVAEVASFGDAPRIRWLKWFTGLLVTLLFFLGLFTLPVRFQLFAAASLMAFMSTIMLIALINPNVFHGIPAALQLSEDDAAEAKYEASKLEDDQKAAYLAKLQQHFEKERPYLQQELTLRTVSEQISVPYRYVSQVINERLEQNFMDFVNSYRIDAAKTMLVDPNWSHLTIDGIAGEAGFKSRSAFYTAFKKATGMTPGAFRKSVAPA